MNKIISALVNIMKTIGFVFVYFFRFLKKTLQSWWHFIKADHRYVYLSTTVMSLLCIFMANAYLGRTKRQLYSIFDSVGLVIIDIIIGICIVFIVFSIVALVMKLITKKNYDNSWIKKPVIVKITRYYSYVIWVIFLLLFLETGILTVISTTVNSMRADSMPDGFFEIMVYTFFKSSRIFTSGISVTIRLALVSTACAFVLSILLVFLRCNPVDKRDNDFVKFLKVVGDKFAYIYATVIRGTPMMVQVLIIYYAGFNLLKSRGMSIDEMNIVWSTFTVGFITISLNSTAYLAEVLRGSIQAIDKGQTEAARSLGFSQWKTMMKVVFPQAVKNSIPAIGNEFIINIKDSVVLNVIGVMDLMYATNTVVGIYFKQLEVYCVCALIYLVLTFVLTKILNVVTSEMGMSNAGVPSSN